MPFTISHPAIVLPLAYLPRKWVSLTGLVVGSLTPDFEYFLRVKMKSIHSHTFEGLFWFDLPVGLVLAFVFHNIVRNALFDNLPDVVKSRIMVFKGFSWNTYFKKNWLVVVVSILVGASSHIFWDSFTHYHGYFVQQILALSDSIALFNLQIPIYRALQHISTLVGAVIIAISIYKLPISKDETKRVDVKFWIALVGITLAIISIKFLFGLKLKEYGDVIVTIISAGLFGLVLVPLLLYRGNNI